MYTTKDRAIAFLQQALKKAEEAENISFTSDKTENELSFKMQTGEKE